MKTIINKFVICPAWKVELCLEGNYFLEENSTKASFLGAKCPIIENNKLPIKRRDSELSIYPFCKKYPCSCLSDFKTVIDIDSDGYSQ